MKHCWHRSGDQHAVQKHEDRYCCWCGEFRCFIWIKTTREPHGDGHGPFSPERQLWIDRYTDELCPKHPDTHCAFCGAPRNIGEPCPQCKELNLGL